MRTRDADILFLPGLGGSGPDHWQTRWQVKLPTARRVDQADWEHPERNAWAARVTEAVEAAKRPVVIVAHSLGVVVAAGVLPTLNPERVAGAFLVAPPTEDAVAAIPEIAADFRPYSLAALPCPATLVASSNDPYCSTEAAEAMAASWGATFIDAGAAGHINTDSGHGPWPEGLMAFAGFLSRL